MLTQKMLAYYQCARKFVKAHFALIFCTAIVAIAVIFTFRLQNSIVGFEKGYDTFAPKHHGSVSSKTLAIISQATRANGFVGYAFWSKDDQNQLVYDYFDRYPVFFSAVMHRILALRTKLSSQIYLAKQVMNLIFVATLFVAFLIGDKLIKNKLLALGAVLIAFANPYLMFYKDMVHFDQPALFGFLLLTYTIALYKIDGLRWPMVIATFVAVALGRGYASFAVLGLWMVIEAVLILRTKGASVGQKVRQVIKHPSFILLVIGILWGGGLLAYNISVEAQKRHISMLQTSIVDSAGRRLSLNPAFNQANEPSLNWAAYFQNETSQIIKWTSPIKWPNPGFLVSLALLVLVFVIIGAAMRRQTLERKIIFILLALAGFVWMIPMRNLAAFHDYTTMYFIGVSLAFFFSVMILLKTSPDAAYYIALLGLVVYLSALIQVGYLHQSIAGDASQFTYDFMRIEDTIGSTGNNVFLDGSIPNGTNAPEFFLQDQYLAPKTLADYVISNNQNYAAENLTPSNKYFFLFKVK